MPVETRRVRPRRSASSRPKAKRAMIPRAVKERGTAKGYHEFDHVALTKLYFEKDATTGVTGFKNTDQTTGAPSGASHRGIQFVSTGDTFQTRLGEGVTAVTISQSLTNYTQLAAIFDNYKIIRERYEFWFCIQPNEANQGGTGASAQSINLNLVRDTNTNLPPGSENEVMQYTNPIWIKGSDAHPKRISHVPYLCVDTSRDLEGTSATDMGMNVAASINYLNTKNTLTMFSGLRGWMSLLYDLTANKVSGYLMIRRVQKRRYRNTI